MQRRPVKKADDKYLKEMEPSEIAAGMALGTVLELICERESVTIGRPPLREELVDLLDSIVRGEVQHADNVIGQGWGLDVLDKSRTPLGHICYVARSILDQP